MSKKESTDDFKENKDEKESKTTEEAIDKDEYKYKKVIVICISILTIIVILIGIKIVKYKDLVYPKSYIYNVDVSKLNEEELNKTISQIEKNILDTKININANNKSFKINTNEIILSLNKTKLKKNIIEYGKSNSILKNIKDLVFAKNKNYKLDIKFDEEVLNKQIKIIAEKSNTNYKNAVADINENKISIEKEKKGFILDEEALMKEIYKQINNFDSNKNIIEVYAEFKTDDAKIKIDDLKTVDTKISEFHTNYSGSLGRRLNIENAAKKIDNIILMPGEEFSYEKVVGPVTYENGYKDAPVIVNGKSSLGVGGGVCQVSSTMYNTQLKAGILPTERRNHSKPVSYVPRGLDATLASGSIDYKFKNTYDYPIIINTYTKDSNLYIEFWSNKKVNKNITYEPISFTNGRSAQTYLYGYDVDGNKVYEKFIDTSIYR